MTGGSPRPVRGIEVAGRGAFVRNHVPVRARHALRDGARAYGSITWSQRPAADFLIIGAKKARNLLVDELAAAAPGGGRAVPPSARDQEPALLRHQLRRGPRWDRSHFPTRARVDDGSATGGRCRSPGRQAPITCSTPLPRSAPLLSFHLYG